jgi:hypothetical protein
MTFEQFKTKHNNEQYNCNWERLGNIDYHSNTNKMSKERIFELIRKEEAALFVGAGMSLYAGYPSGAKLAETLYNNLTSDLRNEIDLTSNLPKLAEDIYYLKGGNKNYLIETLKKEFQKEPTTTETHQLLAKLTFSSFHLSRDAEEREQLTHFYLALKKDTAIEPEERQLILQSLFSRADTGLLKDDSSPTMPTSIIEKFSSAR